MLSSNPLFTGTQVNYSSGLPAQALALNKPVVDGTLPEKYSSLGARKGGALMAAIPEKPLEELIRELPQDLRQQVQDFVEFLLEKRKHHAEPPPN